MARQLAVICLLISIILTCHCSAEANTNINKSKTYPVNSWGGIPTSGAVNAYWVSVPYSIEDLHKPVLEVFRSSSTPLDFSKAQTKYFPLNWSKPSNYLLPRVVKQIATCNENLTWFDDCFGMSSIARAGNYLYSPMKSDIIGFSAYQVFDLKAYSQKTIAEPNFAETHRYSTDTLKMYERNYDDLYSALSPSGEMAVRFFRLVDETKNDRIDALVLWNTRSGKVLKVIDVPMVFTRKTYVEKMDQGCKGAYTRENSMNCIYSSSHPIQAALPATPFFISESDLMWPIVYLEITPDEAAQRFFFQPIDLLTKDEQNWVFSVQGQEFPDAQFVVHKDKTFLYRSSLDSYGQNASDIYEELKKGLGYAPSGFPNKHPFPTFSLAKMDHEVFGENPMVIVASGDFLDESKPVSEPTQIFIDLNENVIPINDYSETAYLSPLDTPSFYPSIYRPVPIFLKNLEGDSSARCRGLINLCFYFDYNDDGQYEETVLGLGTDVSFSWRDPVLQKSDYFLKATTRRVYDDKDDSAKNYMIQGFDPILFEKDKDEHKNIWKHDTLLIAHLETTDPFREREEHCTALESLNTELCNKIQYDERYGNLSNGNFLFKNGDKIKLLEKFDKDTPPKKEGCWYKTCIGFREVKYEANLYQEKDQYINLVVAKNGKYECTFTGNGESCGKIVYEIDVYADYYRLEAKKNADGKDLGTKVPMKKIKLNEALGIPMQIIEGH